MKKEKLKNKELISMIVLVCVIVAVTVWLFLIPVFSANKLADAFDKEKISYEMINNKNVKSIYQDGIGYITPREAAEIDLRSRFDLDGVDFTLSNCGMFYLTDLQENQEDGDHKEELVIGQFYCFRKGSEQVYSVMADHVSQNPIHSVVMRKGRFIFYLLGSEIPVSMENVLNCLSGEREQTFSE